MQKIPQTFKPFFVEVLENSCNSAAFIKKTIDMTYGKECYKTNIDGFPCIYESLYKDIVTDKIPPNKKLIIMSSDSIIASSVIAGLSEKHMYAEEINDTSHVYKSLLHVVYLTDQIGIDKVQKNNLRSCLLSNVMTTDDTFTHHGLSLCPENISLIGFDKKKLKEANDIPFGHLIPYSSKIIDEVKTCVKNITDKNRKTLIVIDLSVIKIADCPAAVRATYSNPSGLSIDEFNAILNILSPLNICGICIVGYDFSRYKSVELMNSAKTITSIPIFNSIIKLGKVCEKKINVFDEYTKFLIWRDIDGKKPGWHVLKGSTAEFRKAMIENFENNDLESTITSIEDDSDGVVKIIDVEVALTSIDEQSSKIYSSAVKSTDKVLYADEKISAVFELIN